MVTIEITVYPETIDHTETNNDDTDYIDMFGAMAALDAMMDIFNH